MQNINIRVGSISINILSDLQFLYYFINIFCEQLSNFTFSRSSFIKTISAFQGISSMAALVRFDSLVKSFSILGKKKEEVVLA